ncbi:MAG: N-acetylmuramoyl-L-alanine amidase [Capsulimonas sp.]|nr:N-acetylmuramoyl-L-alanine amidase [Capsulimonas sp.]
MKMSLDFPIARRLYTYSASIISAIILSAAVTPAHAADSVQLVVGGQPVAFVVQPYQENDGTVFAPVDFVRRMGANYAPSQDGKSVDVMGANGAKLTVPFNMVHERYCVPVKQVATALGASVGWNDRAHTMTLRAKIEVVKQDKDGLSIFTSYPIYYSVKRLEKPQRIYVDLLGADLASSPATVPASNPGVSYIRSGSISYNTVRIVVDLKKNIGFKVASTPLTSHVQVAMSGDGEPPRVASRPQPSPIVPIPVTPRPLPVTPLPVAPPDTPQTVPGLQITDVACNVVSDTLTQIVIKTTGQGDFKTETLSSPSRLAFDLAGASLSDNLKRLVSTDHAIIKSIRSGIMKAGGKQFGRVVLDMTKLVAFDVTTQPSDEGVDYVINVKTPGGPPVGPATVSPVPDSTLLAGKIIMVDPGHGGGDSGAVGIGGAREKDLTLSIGKKLRNLLASNGATVYMTREDDTKPSVAARPQMAIAAHADYFISIHCDDSGSRNSHSGSTVYFHAQNPLCRRFAVNVINRVAAVSGIPPNGVKSDTIRFQTGFGVLRGSPMPAILVECGYMNSESDLSKLRTPAVQQHVAEGIVAGLLDFIADAGNR